MAHHFAGVELPLGLVPEQSLHLGEAQGRQAIVGLPEDGRASDDLAELPVAVIQAILAGIPACLFAGPEYLISAQFAVVDPIVAQESAQPL